MYQDTYMSSHPSTQLIYSLDGLPLSPMGLTPASVEQLHRLGISTIEQLASISLINLASERNVIINLIEQDLRAQLWPAIVHCYSLLADGEGEQSQFVIESELFHFVAFVVSSEEHKYTCNYRWLQAGHEGNIPFHKLKQKNVLQQRKAISENFLLNQVPSISKQQSQAATTSIEITTEPVNAPEIQNTHVETTTPIAGSATLMGQPPSISHSLRLNFPPEVEALPIRQLHLSSRTNNTLERWNIRTIGQLTAQSDADLLKLKNFGVTSLQEIRQALLSISQETLVEIAALQEGQRLIASFPVLLNYLDEIKDFPIQFLNLTSRTNNILWYANIHTLGDLLQLYKQDLLELRNMGSKSIQEIEIELQSINSIEVQQTLRRLREQGRVPANLSLTCLGLPNPESYRKLRAYGIKHFEHLCSYTTADLLSWGLQAVDIASIAVTLRAYNLALRDTSQVSDNILDQIRETHIGVDETASEQQEVFASKELNIQSERTIEQQPISVVNTIYRMLVQVDQRQSEVLRLRYGLDGQSMRTLEEVGQQIGVSRERIRQIEVKALNKLQYLHHRRPIEPLIRILEHALRNANGVMALDAAQEALFLQTDRNDPISDGQFTFILLFARQIQVIKGLPVITLNCEPYTDYISVIPTIYTILKRVIANAFAPLSIAELLIKFVADNETKTAGLNIPDHFIIACLKAHPGIVVDEDDICSLKQWGNKRLDDIIIVMRQQGKPMHFTEIAEQVNRRLPADQQTTIHNVHAQLGRLSNLFIRVGRGLFRLAEEGLIQEGNSTDTAYRILRETGHALDIEVLIDRVLETWHVQRTSVRAGIDLDPRFVKVSRGRYWLAETASSNSKDMPADDFDTLFGDVLLRRREELEQDQVTSNQHDALEAARRLGTSIFD